MRKSILEIFLGIPVIEPETSKDSAARHLNEYLHHFEKPPDAMAR